MTAKRLIKKYPNRRLYDTAESKYVALDDIKRLVLNDVSLNVVDAKTGEDITRSILLQVIVEQEARGQPILTTELMEKIIRFYGDALQALMATFLQRSVDSFIAQQEALHQQVASLMEQTPLSVLTDMAEKNVEMWKNMQESLYEGLGARESARPRQEDDGDDQPV